MFCVQIVAMWAVSTRWIVGFEYPDWWIGWVGGGVFMYPAQTLMPLWGRQGACIPMWTLLVAAALPTVILWHRDRCKKVKPGCCLTCGYDLRASKKTCPECGTAIAPEPR